MLLEGSYKKDMEKILDAFKVLRRRTMKRLDLKVGDFMSHKASMHVQTVSFYVSALLSFLVFDQAASRASGAVYSLSRNAVHARKIFGRLVPSAAFPSRRASVIGFLPPAPPTHRARFPACGPARRRERCC